MTAPPRLTPVDAALAMLLDQLGPVPPRILPLAEAIGRVLAEPLRATGAVPPVATATRDGWAVSAALTEGAGPYAPVPLPALPWLAAGDPLPPGTDAVLPPFARDGEMVLDSVAPGEGVTQPGEAAAAGALLRPVGHLLRPVDLVLAEAGIATATVRIPRIALHGCDALAALVVAEGAELVTKDADLLLTAGQPAERLLCPGIAARPGETTAIGIIGGRPALLLPAPAEDRLAAWWLLGRAAVWALAKRTPAPPRRLVLARKVASPVGLTGVVPLGAVPSGMVPLNGVLAAAEALLIIPPGLEGYESGAMIEACDL